MVVLYHEFLPLCRESKNNGGINPVSDLVCTSVKEYIAIDNLNDGELIVCH